jgi:autotransporter-associated beta strand protein
MRIKPPLLQKPTFAFLSLLAAGTAFAAPITFTWKDTSGDHNLGNTNNWNPLTANRPSSASIDILQFDGSVAGNLDVTNGPGNGTVFDSNPGFEINVAATQTGSVTIVESNTFASRIRLNGTNTFNLANGAGAFSFGNGTGTPLPIALAGAGTGTVHTFTNYSTVNPVTFNNDVYFVMGGGGAHTMALAGPGNYTLNNTFQAQNSGSSLALTVNGPGTVSLVNNPNPSVTYQGTFGNVTLNAGTLQLAANNALGNGNTLVINGGNLDSALPNLVVANNNPETWSGNFTFVGTQNMDTGLGPVTNTGNRIVTVNANTLSVSGPMTGATANFTKAGAGTLALNSVCSYTGGTTISNGVLRIGISLPTGTAIAESLTNYGTLDLNGNSPVISVLNGTGIVDTISGGSPTLTIGDQNVNGSFSGSIKNSAGSLSLTKTGNGTLTLSGASSYNGGTAVNGGTLLVANTSGSGTGSGAITVSPGAEFGGTGIVTGSVNWQAGSFGAFGVTAVSGANTTPLTVSSSVTLNNNSITVNVPGAIPLDVGTYTLMTYNNSGSSGSFASSGVVYTGAGVTPGTASTVITGGGTVALHVVSIINGVHATWTNTVNGNWSGAANWSSNPTVPHAAGDLATLGFGTSFMTVTLDANESVGGLVFTNGNSFSVADAGNTLTFDNSGSGAIIGVASGTSNSISAALSMNDELSLSVYPGTALSITNVVSSTSSSKTLLMNGAGTVTLSGINTYGPSAGTVGTTLSGGLTTQLGNNSALSTGDVVVTNGNETVRALTGLAVANNFDIAGASMSVDNNSNNVTLSGTISGTGSLGKNGAGTLTLNAANSYTNGTSMSAGTLKLGNAGGIPGGAGNGNLNMGTNTTLDLNGFSPVLNGINSSFLSATIDSTSGGAVTLTLGESGAFATYVGSIKNGVSGLALVKDGTGTQTLGGTNTFAGGTTINAGTLRVGNGNTNNGVTGIAVGLGTGPVLDNGTLEFNLFGTNTFTNVISGSGGVSLANNNLTLILSNNANSYSGDVTVNNGSLWAKNVSALGSGPKPTGIHVQNGTAGNSQLHLDGSGGNITTPAGIDFWLSNVGGCLFNEAGNNTINGNILMPFGGGAAYVIVRTNTFLTLNGNANSDGHANGRTLQLGGPGNGLYTGMVSDVASLDNPGAMLNANISKADGGTWTLTGASTTTGTLTAGGGTLVFNGGWTGPAIVNGGGSVLAGNGGVSNLTVNAGGIFVPGGYGAVGGFTVSNLLTLAGTTYVSINKSLNPPNTVVTVGLVAGGGAIANTGSSLVISNLGPALAGGDRFQLFSQPVTNGANMTITGSAGIGFINNLAVDGSVSLVNITPTKMTTHFSGGQVTLSWPADHQGWRLLAQTNLATQGLGTNWAPVLGTDSATSYTTTVDPANGTVFYKLVYP